MKFSLIIALFVVLEWNHLIDFTNSMKRVPKKGHNKQSKKRAKDKPSGISGGYPVEPYQAKFMVAIYVHNQSTGEDNFEGSGVVLNSNFVLTAGHICYFFNQSGLQLNMFFGGYPFSQLPYHSEMTRYGVNFNITNRFLSSYEIKLQNPRAPYYEDICVVKLSQPIEEDVSAVHLPPPIDPNYIDYYVERYIDTDDCWSFGYGKDWQGNFGNLNRMMVPIHGLDNVAYTILDGVLQQYPQEDTEPSMALRGDSGGALLCRLLAAKMDNDFNKNHILMGVIRSHVQPKIPFDPNYPYITKYEPVRYFRPWIDSIIHNP